MPNVRDITDDFTLPDEEQIRTGGKTKSWTNLIQYFHMYK